MWETKLEDHFHIEVTVTEVELAYTAGLFDGEGSISVFPAKGRKDQWALRVMLSNTDQRMIWWFQERWPGVLSIRHPKPGKNHKISYYWMLAERKAVRFLEDVYPYLVEKQERAMYAMKLKELVPGRALSKTPYGGRAGRRKPPEVTEAQRVIYLKMKELNRRGLPPAE